MKLCADKLREVLHRWDKDGSLLRVVFPGFDECDGLIASTEEESFELRIRDGSLILELEGVAAVLSEPADANDPKESASLSSFTDVLALGWPSGERMILFRYCFDDMRRA